MPQRFPLAPMTADLRIMTWVLMLLPIALGLAALRAPLYVGWVLGATTLLLVLSYASVWLLWRPSSFQVSPERIDIVWPLRRRSISRGSIVSLERLKTKEFRQRYGFGMRIGAGGLWGGFGLLKTSGETFSMWISRTDELVLVRLSEGRALLLTPERPDRFLTALGSAGSPSPSGALAR